MPVSILLGKRFIQNANQFFKLESFWGNCGGVEQYRCEYTFKYIFWSGNQCCQRNCVSSEQFDYSICTEFHDGNPATNR